MLTRQLDGKDKSREATLVSFCHNKLMPTYGVQYISEEFNFTVQNNYYMKQTTPMLASSVKILFKIQLTVSSKLPIINIQL